MNKIKTFFKSLGLVKYTDRPVIRSYDPQDYILIDDESKLEIHLSYLQRLEDDENNRLSIIESKTSQLISQTGIIFSLLSLFVPLLFDKASDFYILIKVGLLLLLLFAFCCYMLTIRNAIRNLKVNDFPYMRPSEKNVLNFQNKTKCEFYREVVKDILIGFKHNAELNNKKATNLIYSYNAFKLANIFTAILVVCFCLAIILHSSKEPSFNVKGLINIEVHNPVKDSSIFKKANAGFFLTDSTNTFQKPILLHDSMMPINNAKK